MKKIRITVTLFLLIVSGINAQLKLPALVGDSMILQRDMPINIWGWSLDGREVAVVFNKEHYQAKPDINNKWSVSIHPTKAGGPFTMQISTANSNIEVKNILVGDVWVCSGQSNMEMQMKKLEARFGEDIFNSTNAYIREFHVKQQYSFIPKTSVEGAWKMANPVNVRQFTAAGYYMAKYLYEKYKVPIGIIHSSWGGTPAQAWVSEEGLKDYDDLIQRANYFKDDNNIKATLEKDKAISDAWYDQIKNTDQGLLADASTKWADVDIDTTDWKTIKMPSFLGGSASKENTCGVVWLRKEISLTKEMIAKDATLDLGMIDDDDITYFNGKIIGKGTSKYALRNYTVPASLLREGKNVITVRIVNTDGNVGFIKDKKYRLTLGKQEIDLTGEWKFKVGVSVNALPVKTFIKMQNQPTSLFNAMIAPLIPYTIKGAAWYQGESNSEKGKEYNKLLTTLIGDWRNRWQQGNFPFLIVQLANYMDIKDQPSEGGWAFIRESQLKVSQQVPNCGLAVTIDVGETNDVHYINKKDVGKRLALAAEKVAYKDNRVVYSGPIYQSMKIEGNKIILSFSNVGSGLLAKGGNLKQFSIAGNDKKFVWAKATIENNKVIVWSDDINEPVAVRYAWANNPAGCNLYNQEDLPATPFRTDDW